MRLVGVVYVPKRINRAQILAVLVVVHFRQFLHERYEALGPRGGFFLAKQRHLHDRGRKHPARLRWPNELNDDRRVAFPVQRMLARVDVLALFCIRINGYSSAVLVRLFPVLHIGIRCDIRIRALTFPRIYIMNSNS